ncbi:metal ABC transporter solute-binding protein, Zn/Mn family [Chloroflexota bacterium]
MTSDRFARGASILFVFTLVVVTAASIISCGSGGEANSRIEVVVTIPPQAEFMHKVGGERVDVTIMVPSGTSPHTYAPKPSQLVDISRAEMYAKVGSGIDFELAWMDKITAQNKDMLIVDCSEGIILQENIGDLNHGDEDGAHGELDPHIWVSPLNAMIMVRNIYDGLVQVDPDNRAYYGDNMNAYLRELEDLDNYISDSFAEATDRIFMVYHPTLGYFAQEYDLTMLSIEEDGKEPTAAGLADLIDQAQEHGIKVIFASPQFSLRSAETVAAEIGGRVALFDSLSEDYIANLRTFSSELSLALVT